MSSDSYINVNDVRNNPAIVAAKILTSRATDKGFMAGVYANAKPEVEFVDFADEWMGTCPICGEVYWGSEEEARTATQDHLNHVAECFRRNPEEAWFALKVRVSQNRRQSIEDAATSWREYGLLQGIDF
jgi:hypothetical protein